MSRTVALPPWVSIDPLLKDWLKEDIGRGDATAQTLLNGTNARGTAIWTAKAEGMVAGLPLARRIFELLGCGAGSSQLVDDGTACTPQMAIARFEGPLEALLMGERTALNLVMRLSGIASTTRQYVERIADLPAQLTDTRKTTPGLRIFEKYASRIGGATNHRMGLDDAVMVKDNHIAAAGGIEAAIARIRPQIPYPMTIEVETETLDQVREALEGGADIIMLDNMSREQMCEAVALIRGFDRPVKIEASGNITLERLRSVAETGVDYISTSAPITRSHWLDISMKLSLA
ncbi:carboxylating nicotinate-nucleotide diphosphorylase [Baaleninema sp.]|uniref:carboxylating nicotinate-nucleotide diphosphorylase n=1 Tax=Baaleninema sp. TaxID=3101197 RepID=UPI003D0319FF